MWTGSAIPSSGSHRSQIICSETSPQRYGARFPEAPPYAGAHSEVVPHLTIGHDAARPVLENAAEAVSAHLPIRATVEVVRLIAGTPDHCPWLTLGEFPLGTSSATRSSP